MAGVRHKKKQELELRYYGLPANHLLPLLGSSWIRHYGEGVFRHHFHNCMEIGYCRSGKGQLFLNGVELNYSADMISIIPRNCSHHTESLPGGLCHWEYIFVDLEPIIHSFFTEDDEYAKRLLTEANRRALFFHIDAYPDLSALIKQCFEELRKAETGYESLVHTYILAIAIHLLRLHGKEIEHVVDLSDLPSSEALKSDRSVLAIISYISENYPNISKVSQIAEHFFISETHLRRLFQKYLNTTPGNYLTQVKIAQACQIMLTRPLSMKDLALELGFSDVSTFYRSFKKIKGCSPHKWKETSEDFRLPVLSSRILVRAGW